MIIKRKKTELSKAIEKEKDKAWKRLSDETERDVWGNGYKIMTKKMGKFSPICFPDEELLKEAKDLFPTHQLRLRKEIRLRNEDTVPFTLEEVKQAAKIIKAN